GPSRAVAGRFAPRFQTMVEPPSNATLDGTSPHSNSFLRGTSHDAAPEPSKIALASFECQAARLQYRRDGQGLVRLDLAREDASRLQQLEEVDDQGPITGKTVGATIEGQSGIVEGNFTR